MSFMKDDSTLRYGVSVIPKQAQWGPAEFKLDNVMVVDKKPITVFLVGEVESTSFYNPETKALQKYVWISVKPLFSGLVTIANKMVLQLSNYEKG